MNHLRRFLNQVYGFLLTPQSARQAGVVRLLVGGLLFLTELGFRGHVKEWFSDQGFFTGTYMRGLAPSLQFSLLSYVHSAGAVQVLYLILLVATILFALGLWGRAAGVVTFVLFLSFQVRNLEVQNAGFTILRILCLYFLFLPAKPLWEIGKDEEVPGWPIRLMQLQVVYVYFFTGIFMLRGDGWFFGTAAFSILANPNYSVADFGWIAHYPVLANLLTYAALATIYSFSFLVWHKPARRWVLLAAAILTVLICLFMTNMILIGEVLLATLLLFPDAAEYKQLAAWTGSLVRRLRTAGAKRARVNV